MSDYNTANLATIGQFRFWCQKVLPAVYDDSLSYYELLCKIVHKLNEMIEVDNIQSEAIKIIIKELNSLKKEYNKFVEGGFEEYYESLLEEWINNHLPLIYELSVQQIFFSIDESGYLIAHVPVGWNQIRFSTPMVYSDQSSYGRLCLTYDFDGELEV